MSGGGFYYKAKKAGMDEMRDCPFCGGEPSAMRERNYFGADRYAVICERCGVALYKRYTAENGVEAFRTTEEALEAWNRRTDETSRQHTEE